MERRRHFDDNRRVRTLDRICRDPRERRELLWLRAKSKEDEDDARALLETDPGIRERLERRYDIDWPEGLVGRGRREAFEALWDEHYAHLEERHARGGSRA